MGMALAGKINEAIATMVGAWTSGIKPGDFLGSIRAVVDGIAGVVRTLAGIGAQAAMEFGTGLATALSKAFGVDIAGAAKEGVAKFRTAVAGGMVSIKNAGLKAIQALVDGIRDLTVGKLTEYLNKIKEPIDQVKGWFKDLYQSVVGGSYYTDMVTGIGDKTAMLSDLMVKPTGMMSEAVASQYKGMAASVSGSMDQVAKAANVPLPMAKPANDYQGRGPGRTPTGRFKAGGDQGDQQEREERAKRITDIKTEIGELERLNAAQGISSEEYARVAAQIDGERAARQLGLDVKSAEGQAIAALTIQQNELIRNQERAKTLADTTVQVDQSNRLTMALGQGILAHEAMQRAIIAEDAAKELGLPLGDARVQQLAAERIQLEENAKAQERITAMRDLAREVEELERLNAAELQGAAAYRETAIAIEVENQARQLGIEPMSAEYDALQKLIQARYDLQSAPDPSQTNALAGANAALRDYALSAQMYGEIAGRAVTRTLGEATTGVADILESFTGGLDNARETAKQVLDDMLKSIQRQLFEFMAQQLVMSFISMFMGGTAGGAVTGGMAAGGGAPFGRNAAGFAHEWAKGGVPGGPGISAFSNSVVTRPTFFARGANVMGEAGPEAIMPLRRTSSGDLGVQVTSNDNGPSTVVQVIDQRGSSAPPVEQSRSRGADGVEQVRIIIRDENRKMTTRGDLDRAQSQRFGNRTALNY